VKTSDAAEPLQRPRRGQAPSAHRIPDESGRDSQGPGEARGSGGPETRGGESPGRRVGRRSLPLLALGALGVVYGDIGTSPLYAFRECFAGTHAVPPTPANVLGVLSLIVYSLVVVVSLKYIAIVMRADNQGEGGVLALTSMLPEAAGRGSTRPPLVLLGVFGAALLYSDGMITPPITVLGALEGLTVATPVIEPYIAPLAVALLAGLFSIQQYGTGRVGGLFGPVMAVWFAILAVLGVVWIARVPGVVQALSPAHALTFFQAHGFHGFAVLGTVFLVVTGAEALYADMGHFGKRPIRVAWFSLVLPALLLNYLGQGALLLQSPESARQPFFLLAPSWALVPLVALATTAAAIASQALISGAFSLTRQAIQLGYSPRLDIAHTSSREMGQVYVPQVNWALMIATMIIAIGFGSSAALAGAYGLAISLTMVITVLLLHVVATERWRWPLPVALAATGGFLLVDAAFFGANLLKFLDGGWLPILIAVSIFTMMTTWKTGRALVRERLMAQAVPLEEFTASLEGRPLVRVPGAAVFMTGQPRGTPLALAHNIRHNKVLHEQIVVLNVSTVARPYVRAEDRVQVRALSAGFYAVSVRYGFMQDPDVPLALAVAWPSGGRSCSS
jgi:KUP system potassium uptake protein